MELLLNAVWVVLAAVAVAAWAKRTGPVRHAWRVELLALGCALVLLFPIISLSDDLQAEPAPAEAGRGQPTVKNVGDRDSVVPAKTWHAGVAVVPSLPPDPCGRSLFFVDDRAPVIAVRPFARHSALRAPPVAGLR